MNLRFTIGNWNDPQNWSPPQKFIPIPEHEDYTNSQIERAHNGKFYMVKPNGDLGYFTDQFNGIQFEVNIGSSAIIKNGMHENDPYTAFDMYLIPDQIDGCEYDNTTDDEITCCYSYTEMPVVNTMGGSVAEVNGDLKVQSDVTWTPTSNPFTTGSTTPEIYFRGDIIVEPGAKLTINDMTIYMDDGKKISLTNNTSGGKGSKLIVDGSTLTAYDCDESIMWYGITVFGNDGNQGSDPLTSSQPYLNMENSTLEYSTYGVFCRNSGNARLFKSTFKDNYISCYFYSTDFEYSYVTDCDFISTDDIYEDKSVSYPYTHIYFSSADNISVSGCDYINNASPAVIPGGYDKHGTGIMSYYSDIDVKSVFTFYPPYYLETSFENLYYGIKNYGGNLYVNEVEFTDNKGGVWVLNSNAPTITECDFKVLDSDGNSELFDSFGLYLDGCTGYQVEENNFHDGLLGCQVYNSGDASNMIYKNYFSNLIDNGVATGIVAVGQNINSSNEYQGLRILCNEFTNTDYAISVLGSHLPFFDPYNLIETSIAKRQSGYYVDPGQWYSAGNKFCGNDPNEEYDFHFGGGIYDYGNYLYYDQPSDPQLYSYNPNEITKITLTSIDNSCPSNLGGTSKTKDEDLSLLSYEENEQEAEINEATSGINEFSLLNSAQTATASNQGNVHNELMTGSPYLSDTILITYMNNAQVSELSRTTVLKANSPLPEKAKTALYASSLSQEYMSYLDQFQEGINPLEKLYLVLNGIRNEKQKLMFDMQRDIINHPDSIDVNAYMQTIAAENSVFAKQRLFDIYMSQNNHGQAQSVLNDLQMAALDAESHLNIDKLYIDSLELAIEMNFEQREQIVENNTERLYALADDVNNLACSGARAILETYDYEEYTPMTALPNPNKQKSAMAGNPSEQEDLFRDQDIELSTRFNIFPNPASDILSVEFITSAEACTFVIYDIHGRQIRSIERNESLGYLTIDVSELESGNYILYSPQLGERKQFVVKR